MQIFIGHLIRNELRRQGHTNAWLAERIGLTPRALQKIYNKHSLDTQQLLLISRALHHDFFRHYSLQVNEKQEQPEDNPVDP
ncbi:MAG: XRE family transcriptional regulator [Bacteroidales bacterium]|nr:XRE family transcriptional regulator [Bacteroidales bacterium]